MKQEELTKWLEKGSSEVVDFYDLIHSPEFVKEMENEHWDEYKEYDFQ